MSKQLKTLFQQVLEMKYFKNENVSGKKTEFAHEDAVEEVIKNNGFVRAPIEFWPETKEEKEKKKLLKQQVALEKDKSKSTKGYKAENKVSNKKIVLNKKIMESWVEHGDDTKVNQILARMPVGTYVRQPISSQSHPDFLLRDFDGRFVAVECKSSSKNTFPMWNDSLPQQNMIYVLCSEKMNKTTLFFGKDVIEKEISTIRMSMDVELNAIIEKYKPIIDKQDKKRRGFVCKYRVQNFQAGDGKNYFTHADKELCEKNVLIFCEGTTESTLTSGSELVKLEDKTSTNTKNLDVFNFEETTDSNK